MLLDTQLNYSCSSHTAQFSFCECKYKKNSLILQVKRQDFVLWPLFVVSSPPRRNNSEKIWPKFLESGKSRCTFAVANKLQRRVKAAAQQSSNKFDSAFALHFTCIVNQNKRHLSDKTNNKKFNNLKFIRL